jgi:hypothetical protein
MRLSTTPFHKRKPTLLHHDIRNEVQRAEQVRDAKPRIKITRGVHHPGRGAGGGGKEKKHTHTHTHTHTHKSEYETTLQKRRILC